MTEEPTKKKKFKLRWDWENGKKMMKMTFSIFIERLIIILILFFLLIIFLTIGLFI
jgi:Na+-driven multidrug efflux pump